MENSKIYTKNIDRPLKMSIKIVYRTNLVVFLKRCCCRCFCTFLYCCCGCCCRCRLNRNWNVRKWHVFKRNETHRTIQSKSNKCNVPDIIDKLTHVRTYFSECKSLTIICHWKLHCPSHRDFKTIFQWIYRIFCWQI